ncbi:MAG: hypothetical protein IPM64_17905 [Phycisphaerales bacterium]|nr:hypothetical protein [Phycisphaerales bacterium]
MTRDDLQRRIDAGDWKTELLSAWKAGSRMAVAQLLNEPDVDHYVLVWFCRSFCEAGEDLEELEDAMESAHDAAS